MKWLSIAAIALVVIAGLYWFVALWSPTENASPTPTPEQQNNQNNKGQSKQYSNATYGISFAYPASYVITEREVGSAARAHYNITLTRASDLPVPTNGEGPPTISLDFFQNNLDKLTLDSWLTGTNFSNFKLGDGQKASTTVGGAAAVRYRWSGLYEANSVAFLHRDNVIMVSGTYLNSADPIVSDFEAVVKSIRLQ